MSNFQFLNTEWPSIYTKMKKAEECINTDPDITGIKCRSVLEQTLLQIYEFENLELPYQPTIHTMLIEPDFKAVISSTLMLNGLFYVKKVGNAAAHTGKVMKQEAKVATEYMFGYLKWFARVYSEVEPETPRHFNFDILPKIGHEQKKFKELKAQLEKEKQRELEELQALVEQLQQKNQEAVDQAKQSTEALELFKVQTAQAKAELEERKVERQVPVEPPFTEAQTRKHLIDIDLKEVGWDELRDGRELEYPVKGMPITNDNPKGNGYVDYVLWGDDGKPLALVEAKRTSKDAEVGKHQATLYADCLEQMHGLRPVIFFTNGYETMLWDDTFYSAARRVHGFYSKEELQWMTQQRETRKDLRLAKVNKYIAGRDYQMMAIQRVAETLTVDGEKAIRGGKREALLVMATGSGKTRTSAALVEVLFKSNWVKRVLFLADRNALVTQAKKNFGEYLPELSSIDLTQEKENDTTRLVFSTYPSMMNRIDNVKSEDKRFYGVGHFDLIIVDEAHRSVYNRYRAIFEYFDAMVIGLTATPKDSIDHNTFELFGCSTDDPTYAYELEEATPTYLCPYETMDVSTEFLREGIKYKDLSLEDKKKYEDTFEDKSTGLFPEEIHANAMNKRLFNEDTVNKVLDTLMTEGLKIEGGDKIGRTIIFAVNQNHAKFIVECFNRRYPDKPSGFIAMITNEVSHAQDLIDKFCDKEVENNPQIAVSVDMMDTGVDAPRVLNLVFFKVVRSFAKFWQMIGRGTRLCPDVYAPNINKDKFMIFDVCQNFDFFEINKKGKESGGIKPITQQIFEARLQLSRLLAETGEEENIQLANDLRDVLHASILRLVNDEQQKNRFQVQMELRHIHEFSNRERWSNLDEQDVHLVQTHLSYLPSPEVINETARRFDLLILNLQLAKLLINGRENIYHDNLMTIAEQLSKKYTIPDVAKRKAILEQMKDPYFYKELTNKRIEDVRVEIRDLMKYFKKDEQKPVYLNIQDSEVQTTVREPLHGYGNAAIYKKRVERFIRENKNNLTISKLATNQVITTEELKELERVLFDGEERGTKEEYVEEYGEQPLGNFIRGIIGLDEEAARAAFADFLQAGTLRADQMTFINQIITYLTKNGTIDRQMLFIPPFTNVNDQGLFGVFDDGDATKVISIIDLINENAMVG